MSRTSERFSDISSSAVPVEIGLKGTWLNITFIGTVD